MVVVFCLTQFYKENLRLQPWLTIHRVSLGLIVEGHHVHVVTDNPEYSEVDGIRVHSVESLRGTNSSEIEVLIRSISPDCVFVTVTPLSLATSGWYKIFKEFRTFAFLSYPFYTKMQIIRALPHITFRDKLQFGRHALVPKLLWAFRLKRYFKGAICQSENTGNRMKGLLGKDFQIRIIPPGIDKDIWEAPDHTNKLNNESIFLYAGSVRSIRGFDIILKAFSKISDPRIKLRILARGACSDQINRINVMLKRYGIEDRAVIKGGWLTVDEFREEIQSSRAVLLPFVLVPSELPVTVMEVISCGTPVIVTDIDGLPDAAADAGVVVPQANAGALAAAIKDIHFDGQLNKRLVLACKKRQEYMSSWGTVSRSWIEVASN